MPKIIIDDKIDSSIQGVLPGGTEGQVLSRDAAGEQVWVDNTAAGLVDDVLVNGVSVVTDKVADIEAITAFEIEGNPVTVSDGTIKFVSGPGITLINTSDRIIVDTTEATAVGGILSFDATQRPILTETAQVLWFDIVPVIDFDVTALQRDGQIFTMALNFSVDSLSAQTPESLRMQGSDVIVFQVGQSTSYKDFQVLNTPITTPWQLNVRLNNECTSIGMVLYNPDTGEIVDWGDGWAARNLQVSSIEITAQLGSSTGVRDIVDENGVSIVDENGIATITDMSGSTAVDGNIEAQVKNSTQQGVDLTLAVQNINERMVDLELSTGGTNAIQYGNIPISFEIPANQTEAYTTTVQIVVPDLTQEFALNDIVFTIMPNNITTSSEILEAGVQIFYANTQVVDTGVGNAMDTISVDITVINTATGQSAINTSTNTAYCQVMGTVIHYPNPSNLVYAYGQRPIVLKTQADYIALLALLNKGILTPENIIGGNGIVVSASGTDVTIDATNIYTPDSFISVDSPTVDSITGDPLKTGSQLNNLSVANLGALKATAGLASTGDFVWFANSIFGIINDVDDETNPTTYNLRVVTVPLAGTVVDVKVNGTSVIDANGVADLQIDPYVDAPVDGSVYGRKDAAWEKVVRESIVLTPDPASPSATLRNTTSVKTNDAAAGRLDAVNCMEAYMQSSEYNARASLSVDITEYVSNPDRLSALCYMSSVIDNATDPKDNRDVNLNLNARWGFNMQDNGLSASGVPIYRQFRSNDDQIVMTTVGADNVRSTVKCLTRTTAGELNKINGVQLQHDNGNGNIGSGNISGVVYSSSLQSGATTNSPTINLSLYNGTAKKVYSFKEGGLVRTEVNITTPEVPEVVDAETGEVTQAFVPEVTEVVSESLVLTTADIEGVSDTRIAPTPQLITGAPQDGDTYARKNGAWVSIDNITDGYLKSYIPDDMATALDSAGLGSPKVFTNSLMVTSDQLTYIQSNGLDDGSTMFVVKD